MKSFKISRDNLKRRRFPLSALVLFTLQFFALPYAMVAQTERSISSIGGKTDGQTEACIDADIAKLPQPRYIGLWRAGTGQEIWQSYGSWASLVAAHQGMQPQSLIDIETYVENGSRSYAAVWRSGPAGDELTSDADLASFEATRLAREQSGFGLTEVEMVPQGDAVQVLAVWRPGAPAVELLLTDNAEGFETAAAAMAPTHYLIDLETWRDAEARRYLGVFRPRIMTDGEQVIRLAKTWCVFHDDYHGLEASYRLDDLELYVDDQGERLYVAFWSQGSGADYLWIGYGREGEHGFAKADQTLISGASALRLIDLEILDEATNLRAEPDPNQRSLRIGKRSSHRAGRDDGPRRTRSVAQQGAPGSITSDDDPVINGAPVLHDTGSSGPD